MVHVMDGYEETLADRVYASLLSHGKRMSLDRHLTGYSGGGGMLLNDAESRILCAYGTHRDARLHSRTRTCAADGSSWAEPGAGCIAGCLPAVHSSYFDDDAGWCSPSAANDDWCDGRPWRPADVPATLAARPSNASLAPLLVLDGPRFKARQPHSVDAIFAVATDPDGGAAAHRLHLSFLQAFPFVRSDDFPFLVYDPRELDAPFSLAATTATDTQGSQGAHTSGGGGGGFPQPPPPPPPPWRDGMQGTAQDDPCHQDNLNARQYTDLSCRGYGR